ncbi:ATP-binding protein [Tepidibacter hydrothermalis]|uniref:Stage 0 sporulation protein A homolog n=1 Tax=Tepidibacter hydrothermalis TaxID=3036126 RepID=A0ABY8EEV5_9FIRM|nr:ATP-binding protein [Tepidibacter hydrothermalis]WFD10017.1 ATP-binding protein [Tepidibacter hydrothermalis]
MSICKSLSMASKLNSNMILSTKLYKDYTILFKYINIILRKEGRIIIIVDEIYENDFFVEEKLKEYRLYEHIKSGRVIIKKREDFINNMGLFYELKIESEKLGYETNYIVGIYSSVVNMKTELIKKAIANEYKICCYYNVLELSIEDLLEISVYYEAILFEDDETIEIYNNKKIKELELILQSIRSSVIAKKNTYDNVKDLEKLNSFLGSVNTINNLDDFLKKFLELVSSITLCKRSGVLTKSEFENFQIYYEIGDPCECVRGYIDITFNENELIKTVEKNNKVMVFLNINEFTVIYLCFDKNKKQHMNKEILEIYSSSAKNIVNSFLEKIKNDRIISQNEKLKALGEISNGVAHDFNNILATISGYVDLSLAKRQDDNIREYLEIIKRASLDGAEMLRRIQEFTKNIREEENSFFRFERIMKIVLNMINPRISDKNMLGIDININEELNAKGHVKGREFEIREVIINILNNAIDAMPNGGDINIKTYNMDTDIYIEIEDSGNGIPKNILSRIFDPFFSTKGVNGNGIGLSVSYKIIKDHGGSIKVETEEGVGSKFIVSIPTHLEEVVNISNESEKKDEKYHKILVVDDKVPVAMATGEIIKSIGKEVEICYSAKEALQKLEFDKYDLIISDLAMPNLNGIELAKKVKSKYVDIKFVLMTGWLGDIDNYNDTTIDYILEKPFGIDEIKKILQMLN